MCTMRLRADTSTTKEKGQGKTARNEPSSPVPSLFLLPCTAGATNIAAAAESPLAGNAQGAQSAIASI